MSSTDSADQSLASRLLALGAATLGESGGRPMHPRMKPAWPGAALAAPAYTVGLGKGDNLAIHVAVTRAPAGSALVVEVAEPRALGYWGEVLTTAAESRGLAGLVIDGGVRDLSALEAHGFAVFSPLVALPGATKLGGGSVSQPVTVGEVDAQTGDWVVGDCDGVVVIPVGRLQQVIEAGEARATKEEGYFQRLREGATTLDLLGLDSSAVPGS